MCYKILKIRYEYSSAADDKYNWIDLITTYISVARTECGAYYLIL